MMGMNFQRPQLSHVVMSAAADASVETAPLKRHELECIDDVEAWLTKHQIDFE